MFFIARLFITLLIIIIPVFFIFPASSQEIPSVDSITEFTDDYFNLEKSIPGSVVVIVIDGKIIYLGGFGYSNLGMQIPMDPSKTLVPLGSISKLLTAVTVMAFAEKNSIDLDKDLRSIFDREGIDIGSNYPITLSNLLTHSSGIGDRKFGISKFIGQEKVTDIRGLLKTNPPAQLFPPGTAIVHSDIAFSMAGLALEVLSGENFTSLSKDLIFSPIGMKNSCFINKGSLSEQNVLSPNDGLLTDKSCGSLRITNTYAQDDTSYRFFQQIYGLTVPSSNALSTGEDIGKFISTIMQDRENILKSNSVINLLSQQASNYRRMNGVSFGLNEESLSGYKSWSLDSLGPNSSAFIDFIPELKLGVFVAGNIINPSGAFNSYQNVSFLNQFTNELINELWPEPSINERELQLLTADDRADYAAAYVDSRIDYDTPLKLKRLFNQVFVNQISDVRIFFDGETYRKISLDIFQSESDPSKYIRFLRHKGTVTHMLLPNVSLERVSFWSSIQTQVIIVGIAFSLLLLGSIIVIVSTVGQRNLFWPNIVGLSSSFGAFFIALTIIFEMLIDPYQFSFIHGLIELPIPLLFWILCVSLAILSFVASLFARGLSSLNRWGLVLISLGWVAYYSFLENWNLIS